MMIHSRCVRNGTPELQFHVRANEMVVSLQHPIFSLFFHLSRVYSYQPSDEIFPEQNQNIFFEGMLLEEGLGMCNNFSSSERCCGADLGQVKISHGSGIPHGATLNSIANLFVTSASVDPKLVLI